MKLNYKQLTDRELLEQILAAQVLLTQRIERMNAFMLQEFGYKYAEESMHKDEALELMFESKEDLDMQLEILK